MQWHRAAGANRSVSFTNDAASRSHGQLQLLQAVVERLPRLWQQLLQGERPVHRGAAHEVRAAAALLQTLHVFYAGVAQRVELADHGESVTICH